MTERDVATRAAAMMPAVARVPRREWTAACQPVASARASRFRDSPFVSPPRPAIENMNPNVKSSL